MGKIKIRGGNGADLVIRGDEEFSFYCQRDDPGKEYGLDTDSVQVDFGEPQLRELRDYLTGILGKADVPHTVSCETCKHETKDVWQRPCGGCSEGRSLAWEAKGE